jgi:predicted nucleic acid-binding protein
MKQEGDIRFIDSNIWLYALLQHQETQKADIARLTIQDSQKIIVSTQVINEVCVNLIKKISLPETQVQKLITAFYEKCFDVVELNQKTLQKSSQLREKYNLSFWDSLIVASALQGHAMRLYSEDMQNGLVVENQLTIINPFASLVPTH